MRFYKLIFTGFNSKKEALGVWAVLTAWVAMLRKILGKVNNYERFKKFKITGD